MTPRLSRFLASDSGAVTVDWVVLTAAVVGIGMASAAAVRTGTGDLATDIEASLTDATMQDQAWESWPNQGLTNGICPGPAALEASYDALVAAGETFEDLVRDGATGPMSETWYGTWMDQAKTSGFSADEFVGSYSAWQNNTGPGNPASREFQARFFACTLEASPTDWSAMPGGSFEGYLMWDFNFQLPAG